MKKRILLLAVLSMLLLAAFNLASGQGFQAEKKALFQVPLDSESGLAALEASELPLYARLTGAEGGSYGLVGASLNALRAAGIEGALLDPDMAQGQYYLATLMPGRPAPDWESYGQLLLDDGLQLLLRMEAEAAEALAQYGVALRALTLNAKPLRSQSQSDAFPRVISPDPLVQLMIDQVDSSTVYSYTGGLSGEWPVIIAGSPYTIATRHTYSGVPIQKATQYVGEHLAALGLDVEYHQWSGATYPNVIGELPGLVNPDQIFIIGGHVDDMPSGPLAPGADDNASGSIATLIAADILTQYQWGCTLRFALWTGEEQGLLGSEAYAERAYNAGEDIAGYLNLDMIAWNTPSSSPDIDLHANASLPGTLAMAQLFADVVDAYGLNLIPEIIPSGTGASDHASFWAYSYDAILGIEDMSDFNPRYHTPGDQLQYLDIPYYTDFVKASLATLVHMSGCLIPGSTGAIDGHVSAADGGAPIAGAELLISDPAGHAFHQTTDPSGYYSQTLMAGTYTVTASAYGFQSAAVTDVLVITDTVTTVDLALDTAPAYLVSGTVTEEGTGFPLLAEISFQGSPVSVWSDAGTGYYQATVAEGTYTMRVQAALHDPAERPVTVDQDQTQDFELSPLPCILLVDDDNNSPNLQPFYSAALDALGHDYNLFVADSGNGPDLEQLTGYRMVIWYTGDKYGGSAGPNANDEVALANYLEDGGRLFLSGQDYLYDNGLTSFGQSYLGISTFSNDSGNAATKYGVAGDPVGDGLGPYSLSYPGDFSDYGDVVNPGAGASVAFRSSAAGGNNLDLSQESGGWKTVFFGTSWFPVYYANHANGEELLGRIVDWFGGCQPEQGWLAGRVTDAGSGEGLAGAEVTAIPAAPGGIAVGTDPNGYYTLTLPAGVYQVSASLGGYASQVVTGVVVLQDTVTTLDFALAPNQFAVFLPLCLQER